MWTDGDRWFQTPASLKNRKAQEAYPKAGGSLGLTEHQKMGNENRRTLIWATICSFCFASFFGVFGVSETPQPRPWPEQFHSLLFINNSGSLQITHLWYDWPNGRNMNLIQKQLGRTLYDVEWNNKTSFYYYLDEQKGCTTYEFEVGILRPNWLNGSNYLGVQTIDGGFTCNVWEKADFIWYYEDVQTHLPVHWRFYTGMSAHVITFDAGAVLEDEQWQAPYYCFQQNNDSTHSETLDATFSLSKTNTWFNKRIDLF